MGRDHARLQVAIWNDPEWRNLDSTAQHTYLTLISQPRLSYCGVIDYFPGRLAALTKSTTEAKVKAAVRQLERARYVIVDRQTHELLVRTYVRHDGVLDRSNMGAAVGRAFNNVISTSIRDAVLRELARVMAEKPSLPGWIGFKNHSPEAFAMTCDMASGMAFDIGSGV